MKQKKLTITEADFLLANRRASRLEEIQEHGHPVQLRRMIHKSKKAYNRNQSKRAAIKRDDSSFSLLLYPSVNFQPKSHSNRIQMPTK
jgi:hypothetical protein